jgi:hypothetical protein
VSPARTAQCSGIGCSWLVGALAALLLALGGACDRSPTDPHAPSEASGAVDLEPAREAFISTLEALVAANATRPRPLHFDPAGYPGERATIDDLCVKPPEGCELSFPMGADVEEATQTAALLDVADGRRSAARLPAGLARRLLACRPLVEGVFRAGRTLEKPDLTLGDPSTSPGLVGANLGTRIRFALVEVRRLAADPEAHDQAVDRCFDLLAVARDAATLDNLRAAYVLAFRGPLANVCAAALQGASAPRRALAEASLAALEAGLPGAPWLALRNRVDDAFVVLRGRIDDALIARAPAALRPSLGAMRNEDFGVIRPADTGRVLRLGEAMPDAWVRLRAELATSISLLRAGLHARRFHDLQGRWPDRTELGETIPRDARPGGAVEMTTVGADLVLSARAPVRGGSSLRSPGEGDFIERDALGFDADAAPDTPNLIIYTVTPDGRSPHADAQARLEVQAAADREAVRALAERIRQSPAPVAPKGGTLTGPEALRQTLAAWLTRSGFIRSQEMSERVPEVWTRAMTEVRGLSVIFGPPPSADTSAEAFTMGFSWTDGGPLWPPAPQTSLLGRATPAAIAAFEAAAAASAARLPFHHDPHETARLTALLSPRDPGFGDPARDYAHLVDVVLPPGLSRTEFDRLVAGGALPPQASVRERMTAENPHVALHVRDERDVSTFAGLIARTLPDALRAFAEDVYGGEVLPRRHP